MMGIKIGEILVAKRLITKAQLEKALAAQRTYGGKLGTNLVELRYVSDIDLAKILAEQLRMPAAQPAEFDAIPRSILDLVPVDFAREHKLIPLSFDHKLRVAITHAGDLEAIDQLGFMTNRPVQAVIAPEIWVVAAMERYYQVARESRYIRMIDTRESSVGEITHDISMGVDAEYEGRYEAPSTSFNGSMPLATFQKGLTDALTKEAVFELLLDFLGPIFPRMAVYVIRKDQFTGWLLRGFPIHNRDFAHIRVSFSHDTILMRILNSQKMVRGVVPLHEAKEIGYGLLGISESQEIGCYPIKFRGKVIAILLGVPEVHQVSMSGGEDRAVSVACEKAGFGLEMVALRVQLMAQPEPER